MPIGFSEISEILGGYTGELTTGFVEDGSVGPYGRVEFWENFWASLVLTTCLALALSSKLLTLERVSVCVIAVLLFCVLISVIVSRPNLVSVVAGLFIPRVPDYESWVMTDYTVTFFSRSPWLEVVLYFTTVGGGTYDYIGYIGLLRQKRWGLADLKWHRARRLNEP